MADQVPDELKHERIERLVDVVQRIAPSETPPASADGGSARRGPEPHGPVARSAVARAATRP